MPHIEANIVRAWRQADNPNRIHYIILGIYNGQKRERRLFTDAGSALYMVLDDWLEFMGYEMPASASEVNSDQR